MNSNSESNRPGNRGEQPSNGTNHNDNNGGQPLEQIKPEAHENPAKINFKQELFKAVTDRIARISQELFQFLINQPLLFFIAAYAVSKLGHSRKKGTQANMAATACHLRTVARICPGYRTIPLEQLTETDIHDMARQLEDARKPGTDEVYANGSVNAYKSALKTQLEFLGGKPLWLISEERLQPMLAMIELGDPSPIKDCPLPTEQEEQKLLAYVQARCGRGERLKSLIAFLLHMFFGVRRGMVVKIDRTDVDLDRSRLTLTFNKKRGGKNVCLEVEMPPVLKDAFVAYILHRDHHPLSAGHAFLEIQSTQKLLNRAAAASGLQHLTPRVFRKQFITRALEAEIDAATIALIVGHASTKSIEHYQQYRTKHIKSALTKINARHLDVADAGWVDAQKKEGLKHLEAILHAPRKTAAAVMKFLAEVAGLLSQQATEKVLAMLPTPEAALPATVCEAQPNVPRTKPLSEALVVAANLRSLFWRDGVGFNEVAGILDLSRSVMYDVMRGTRQTEDTLAKLATHFQVTLEDLRNSDTKRYDTELVVANIRWLAGRDGMRGLPGVETVAKVVNNELLPPGDLIEKLAVYVGVPREEFLTKDLSKREELERDALELRPEERAAAKHNLAGNLHLQLLLKGLVRTTAAAQMGMRPNQFDNYASGRQLPPVENLERMAWFFNMAPKSLLASPPPIQLAALGQEVLRGIEAKPAAIWLAAQQIGIAQTKLEAIIDGSLWPTGPQLHAIAQYLGVKPAVLLGLQSPDSGDVQLPAAA